MKNIFIIRQIIVSIITFIILSYAFFHNQFFIKIFITPFIICSLAYFGENLFLLLNKPQISHIFKIIFRTSFFLYFLGFLIFAVYYTFKNKTYSLLLVVAIFLVFGLRFFKK